MKITTIHHIELTVTSLEISKDFYSKLPGLEIVAAYPDFIMFHNGYFYLGLTTHKGETKGKFSEKRTGLDHVAFSVSSKEDLNQAIKFFDAEKIPHGEIEQLSNDSYTLVFRDPDSIQLELCWKDGK